jgi:iron complex outermembrane receptor protein
LRDLKSGALSAAICSYALAAGSLAQAQTVEEPKDLDASSIIVTGDAFSETDGLLARQSSTGSRFPVDVERLPNTIRILPQELIEATRATLPQDLTRFVSGVQELPGFGTNSGFVVRGFFANYEILRNGVRGENPGDLSNIERIEVLKGPISSLYGGTGAFAGNINVITKRPLKEFGGEVIAYAGSQDFYRIEGDLGGPLTRDGSVRFRLNGAAESAGSFREFVDSEKYVGSGSLEWDLGPDSTIRLDASYLNRLYSFDEGLPLLDGSLASGLTTFDLPIERTFIDANAQRANETYWNIGGEGNFGLADGLTLRVAGLYTDYAVDIGSSRVSGSVRADGRTVDRITFEGPQSTDRWTVQADLIYRTNAIGKETVFLVGYEHFQQRYDYDASSRNLGQLDLITGVRAAAPPGGLTPAFSGFSLYEGDAVYGQVFSQLTDRLAVLAGLRYDEQTNDGQFNGVGQAISGSQVSPRIGATYFLTDNTILFANWGKSFAPNFAFDIDGDVFESDQVRQIEIGLRQKLFDDRAQLTVAAFDIKRFNVVIPDINNFGQAIASGRQKSRGIEVDLTGELLPGLDAIVTYAYNETRVAEPTDPSFGQQLAAAPEHNASAFLRYELADGPAAGLGFNAGLVFNSAIQASLPNTIVIPSNARLDIGTSYRIKDDWRLAVNVNNVTNSRLYVTNLFALFPQAPRQVFVTLSRSFGD